MSKPSLNAVSSTRDPRPGRAGRRAALRAIAAGLILAAAVLGAAPSRADDCSVAVAANFTAAARDIAAAFETATGHRAVLSFGATGQLYAQITQGAPFEVFLAADAERPARAVAEGLAVPGSVVTYAIGRLVLWSPDPARVRGPETLRDGGFGKLAVANPTTAPYGAAAMQVLAALGLTERVAARTVRGTNIAQTYQFVATGNAELGLVALSQVAGVGNGSRWGVPGDLHDPIRQDAVLLEPGAGKPAATAFLDFLRGDEARAIAESYGYATAD